RCLRHVHRRGLDRRYGGRRRNHRALRHSRAVRRFGFVADKAGRVARTPRFLATLLDEARGPGRSLRRGSRQIALRSRYAVDGGALLATFAAVTAIAVARTSTAGFALRAL